MEMQGAERQRQREHIYEIYYRESQVIRNAYEGMIATRFRYANAVLDRDLLDAFSFKISIHVVRITLMHRSKRINFGIMEECMVKIFHRLRGLIAYVQIAIGNAGQTLACVLCKSMKEIIDRTLDLLGCSMGVGPHGPLYDWRTILDMARRVSDALRSFRENSTNAAVIRTTLVQVVNDIKITLGEMMKGQGSSTGKSDREEASSSNSRGKEEDPSEMGSPETQRTPRAMAVRVGNSAVQFIEELMPHLLVDTYVPGLIEHMEGLLEMSTEMKDSINTIKQWLSPSLTATEFHFIRQSLDRMRDSLTQFWESLQQPELSPVRTGEPNRKKIILRTAIQEFKFILFEFIP